MFKIWPLTFPSLSSLPASPEFSLKFWLNELVLDLLSGTIFLTDSCLAAMLLSTTYLIPQDKVNSRGNWYAA